MASINTNDQLGYYAADNDEYGNDEYDKVDKEILLELGTGFDNNNNNGYYQNSYYSSNSNNMLHDKCSGGGGGGDEQNSFLDNLSDLENMTSTEDNLLSPMDFLFLSQLADKAKPRRSKSSSNLSNLNPKPRAKKSNSSSNLVAAGKPKAVKASKSKAKNERDLSVVSDEAVPKLKRYYSSASIKKSHQTSVEGLRRIASAGTLPLKKSKPSNNDIENEHALGDSYDNSYIDSGNGDSKSIAVVAKERRRERNKVLARKTRVKKKREMETLRDQVCQLQKENDRLKTMVKTKLPSAVSNQVLVTCNIQLPENVMSAVQILLSRLENIETSFGTKLQQHQRAFVISNSAVDDNPLVYVSKGFLDLTGYEAHQVLGRNCRFLQGPDTDMNEVARIRQALNDSQEIRTIIRNYKQNGTPFWNLLQISPLQDMKGNTTLMIATLVEVSLSSKTAVSLLRSRHHSQKDDFEDGVDVTNLFAEYNNHGGPAHVSSDSVSTSSENNNNHSDESVN